MKKIIYGIRSVLTYLRLGVKKFTGITKIRFCFSDVIARSATVKTNRGGNIKFGKMVQICLNVEVAANGGKIVLKGNNYINRNSIIVAHKEIVIGEGTTIGPNVLIYDHDHSISQEEKNDSHFTTKSIIIGKNVWIGAGTIILKGVNIGDNAVIAAGTIVSKNIKENVIVYQKRVDTIRDLVDTIE